MTNRSFLVTHIGSFRHTCFITYLKIFPVGSITYIQAPQTIVDVAIYERLLYYNKMYNFLQIIVMIIIIITGSLF